MRKAFKFAAYGLLVSVPLAIMGQMWLDPQFLLLFHDTSNIMAQAWVMKINSMFSWIPQTVGLSKTPGLLTPVMEKFLAKELSILKPSTTVANILADIPGGMPVGAMFGPGGS